MNNCISCKIANGSIPSKIIYEDEIVLAFLDINPETPGHTLIIPKQHFQDIDDIDEKTYLHIFNVSKNLKKTLIDKLHCDGITLIQNNGECQDVKHYHLHLRPYYKSSNTMSIEQVYDKIMH